MAREIPLTQGYVAIVDDEDYEWLAARSWHIQKSQRRKDGSMRLYAAGYELVDGRTKVPSMHRVILGAPRGLMVDHKNGNGLDNRRENLRIATGSQNNANAPKRANCSSRFKGVSWFKNLQRWNAKIKINGRLKHLGYFTDEREAARAYDAAALEHFGEFARLNFPSAHAGAQMAAVTPCSSLPGAR